MSSAQKFGRGGLVACAWRCDLARGARRSPSRCVCVACAACRVSRACLSGGVGRERMLVQKVRATAVDPKQLTGKVGRAAHRRVRHGVQHHWVVRACVRWASRDSRVQSRVRARVKAASVCCSGPARDRGQEEAGLCGHGRGTCFFWLQNGHPARTHPVTVFHDNTLWYMYCVRGVTWLVCLLRQSG